MSRVNAAAIRAFVSVLGVCALAWVAGRSVTACTTAQKQVARTVVDVADDACVFIPQATGGVCVTADEIRNFLDQILAARRVVDAGRE